jgi:uncharacterized protein YdbL (DUF1318 family)
VSQNKPATLNLSQGIKLVGQAEVVYMKLAQEVATLKGELGPGAMGCLGYCNLEAVLTRLRSLSERIEQLRAERDQLMADQESGATVKEIFALAEKIGITLDKEN